MIVKLSWARIGRADDRKSCLDDGLHGSNYLMAAKAINPYIGSSNFLKRLLAILRVMSSGTTGRMKSMMKMTLRIHMEGNSTGSSVQGGTAETGSGTPDA